MTSNDTQPRTNPASGSRRVASVTNIGEAMQRNRARLSPDLVDTAEMPLVAPAPLAPETTIGCFRHAGYCIKVQYVTPMCLWLWEHPDTADTGPLADFAAYDRLEYQELASVIAGPRTTKVTHYGKEGDPMWNAVSQIGRAELLRKALSLYAYVANGDMMNAADDLVPNPSPERINPDAT